MEFSSLLFWGLVLQRALLLLITDHTCQSPSGPTTTTTPDTTPVPFSGPLKTVETRFLQRWPSIALISKTQDNKAFGANTSVFNLSFFVTSKVVTEKYLPARSVRFLWQQKISLSTLSQIEIDTIDNEEIFNRYVYLCVHEIYFLLSSNAFDYVIDKLTRVHIAFTHVVEKIYITIIQSLLSHLNIILNNDINYQKYFPSLNNMLNKNQSNRHMDFKMVINNNDIYKNQSYFPSLNNMLKNEIFIRDLNKIFKTSFIKLTVYMKNVFQALSRNSFIMKLLRWAEEKKIDLVLKNDSGNLNEYRIASTPQTKTENEVSKIYQEYYFSKNNKKVEDLDAQITLLEAIIFWQAGDHFTVNALRNANNEGIKSLGDFFSCGHLFKLRQCLKTGHNELSKWIDPIYSEGLDQGYLVFENFDDVLDRMLKDKKCGKNEVWLERHWELTKHLINSDNILIKDSARALQNITTKVSRIDWSNEPVAIDEMSNKAKPWAGTYSYCPGCAWLTMCISNSKMPKIDFRNCLEKVALKEQVEIHEVNWKMVLKTKLNFSIKLMN